MNLTLWHKTDHHTFANLWSTQQLFVSSHLNWTPRNGVLKTTLIVCGGDCPLRAVVGILAGSVCVDVVLSSVLSFGGGGTGPREDGEDVVGVDVRVAQDVDEISRFEVADLRDHTGQQRITSDVEWDA